MPKVVWLGGDTNRKRKDPHLKRYLAEHAQKAKRGKTVQNAIAGSGLRWSSQMAKSVQRQSLSDFRAMCENTFKEPLSLGCITDGVRLGKPAKELTVVIVADLASNDVAVLPPQD